MMRSIRACCVRIANLLNRSRRDCELSAELESHVQLHTEDNLRAGMSPAEARRRAILALGGIEQTRERYRDRRGVPLLEQFLRDLGYAARVLARNPGFATTAVMTLALGIGATTAFFSLLDGLLIRSLPVRMPEELVRLTDGDRDTFGYSAFDAIRRNATRLSGVIAASSRTVRIEEPGVAAPGVLHAVTGEYFETLGISARHGRVFTGPDAWSPDGSVAVISDSYWRRRYAADPAAIGGHIQLADRDFTIVGVLPPGFRGILVDAATDIWVPLEQTLRPGDLLWTRGRWLHVIGRLRPGIAAAEAGAEASAITTRTIGVERGANGFSRLRGRFSRPLLVLQVVAGLVLLIGCANVANLILARAAARQREIAIRRAVGASRGRLVRQLLTESLLVSSLGGALGFGVARWLSGALLTFLPPEYSDALANLRFEPGARILGFMFAASTITCVASGLFPALRITRADGTLNVRDDAHTGRTWTSRVLIVGEMSLCTCLVIVAGLFAGSLWKLKTLDAGFALEHLFVAEVAAPTTPYKSESLIQALDELQRRVSALPGVRAAAFSQIGQMSGGGIEYPIHVQGQPPAAEPGPTAFEQRISPGFLQTMGTALVAGRDIDVRDTRSSPQVALVNEAFARHFLGTDRPLGRRFGIDGPQSSAAIEVVGLVRDSKWLSLREEPRPMYYRPFAQRPTPVVTLAVRATGSVESVAASLTTAARGLDSRIAVRNAAPFTEIVDRTLVLERLVAYVAAGFALSALIIACVGLYGVLAYEVAGRRREIGVRLALGATPRAMQVMVVRDTLAMLAIGFPIGLAAAAAGGRFAGAMLYRLTPGDPAIAAGSLALLGLVSLATAWLPAMRASRVDPLTALRTD